MWFVNWLKQAASGNGNVLSERDFQIFLSRELSRLERRPRVLNVACLELIGLDALGDPLAVSVVAHVTDLLKIELCKRDVLANTTHNQLALFLPDSSPDEANQKLSHMQLEVQGAMQLYHLAVSINAGLFSFDKSLGLAEVSGVVDALLLEASALGENIMLQEVAVAPKVFSVPFTVQPSQFDTSPNKIH
jgi:GGDEF domain-containing protein